MSEDEETGTKGEALAEAVNVFRPVFRDLTEDEKDLISEVKTKAQELYLLIEKTPGRYGSLAKTELESSMMWAVKQITA